MRCVIGIEPSNHPVEVPEDLTGLKILDVMGDFLDTREFWVSMDRRVQENVGRLAAAGANARYLRLADRGLSGHSHMIMMDRGSDKALDVILAEAGLA